MAIGIPFIDFRFLSFSFFLHLSLSNSLFFYFLKFLLFFFVLFIIQVTFISHLTQSEDFFDTWGMVYLCYGRYFSSSQFYLLLLIGTDYNKPDVRFLFDVQFYFLRLLGLCLIICSFTSEIMYEYITIQICSINLQTLVVAQSSFLFQSSWQIGSWQKILLSIGFYFYNRTSKRVNIKALKK